MMKNYFNAAFIGIVVASLCISLMTMLSWNGFVTAVILVQGALQGLASLLIYGRLRLPYLLKFLLHALTSYLLAFAMFALTTSTLHVDTLNFSLIWLIIFAVVFVYFNRRNHKSAEEINTKLKGKQHEN